MGFLDKFKGTTEVPGTVSLEKKTAISLKKEEIHKISLTKQTRNGTTPLNGLKARVLLAMDFSGSMNRMFKDGTVQAVLEQMLPMAMEFDDDGQMEVWLFDNEYRRLPSITLNNIENYVQREILANKWHMGGTNYAPVMQDITRVCVETNAREGKLPAYVIFITDGANADKTATKQIIKEASFYPIFWKYVGIGGESFPFLERLDDLKDRNVDNADYFAVFDPSEITYDQLLEEFPDWLEYDQVKGMLV